MYGGEHKQVRLLSEGCLWDTPGERPVAIRGVVGGDPAGQLRPAAFFSPELELVPVARVEWCVLRWNVEVTFEEGRRHRGVETPRPWSALAIARRTPAFFGLFSLVCVMASRLSTVNALQGQATAWYLKEAVTFSDVLAYVRRALWAEKYFNQSTSQDERVLLSAHDWGVLLDQLASAA